MSETPASRAPVLFVGHGSPMNAIEDNRFSQAWGAIGRSLPRPRAILSVSAHWYVNGTFVTDGPEPRTIHDFGGFPRPLFEVQYPARGDEALARRVSSLVERARSSGLCTDWGLDHGTWSVLVHLFPEADVPVLQLSIDRRLSAAEHLAIGRALAPLRDEGVLVLGSGNLTHDLRHAMPNLGRSDVPVPEWASRFDTDVAEAFAQRDTDYLARAIESDAGRRAHPTPDHYLPLLYVAALADDRDRVSEPVSGFDAGSISMRALRLDPA